MASPLPRRVLPVDFLAGIWGTGAPGRNPGLSDRGKELTETLVELHAIPEAGSQMLQEHRRAPVMICCGSPTKGKINI